jgi:hypothetical protein
MSGHHKLLWLALTPSELVKAHLNLDATTANKGKPYIIQ